MKKQFLKISTVLLSVIMFSCGDNVVKDATNISGKIENAEGKMLTLYKLTPTEINPIDSVLVKNNGEYRLAKKIEETGFYRIGINKNDYAVLILKDEDELIELNADATDFANTYSISGSKDSELMFELNARLAENFQKTDSLQQVYQTNMQNPNIQTIGMKLQQEYDATMKNLNEWVKNFINENPSSFATLASIEQLDADQDFEYFKKVNENLTSEYPNSPFVMNLNTRVEAMSKLAINSEAPEINLANPEGKLVPLSSLRGNVVLIDFWASWCKPCRMENPNVVRMYQKYNKKGFEIYAVSLDRGRDEWVQAIKADNLTWTHVSDLMFWNSAAAKQYNVTGIPFTVLIDAEGKIIAKNLRGEALEKKLAEILG